MPYSTSHAPAVLGEMPSLWTYLAGRIGPRPPHLMTAVPGLPGQRRLVTLPTCLPVAQCGTILSAHSMPGSITCLPEYPEGVSVARRVFSCLSICDPCGRRTKAHVVVTAQYVVTVIWMPPTGPSPLRLLEGSLAALSAGPHHPMTEEIACLACILHGTATKHPGPSDPGISHLTLAPARAAAIGTGLGVWYGTPLYPIPQSSLARCQRGGARTEEGSIEYRTYFLVARHHGHLPRRQPNFASWTLP